MGPLSVLLLAAALTASDGQAPRVAVAPVLDAAGRDRTNPLVDALRDLPDLTVIDLRAVRQALGPRALEALLACQDDRCRVAAAGALGWEELLIAELARGGRRLRARRVGPEARATVRVSLEVAPGELEAALRAAAEELFPARAAQARSGVTIRSLPSGAQVRVDGAAPVAADAGRVEVELPPGRHRVEARAPGHAPWVRDFDLALGTAPVLEADLSKRRSEGPWILGASGLALGAGAAALAVMAQLRVEDWRDACGAGGRCAAGFTRARYLDDDAAIDTERSVAIALGAAGAAALAGALVWFVLDPGATGAERFAAGPEGLGIRF